MEPTEDLAAGETVRRLRAWRGLDQRTLAGLVGRNQSWLSRVEGGSSPLNRRTDIEALAAALHVHPADVTGRPYRTAGSRTWEVDALIPAVRMAMVDVVPGARPLPVAELSRRVAGATAAMWRTGDMVALASSLPGLLGSVRLSTEVDGEEERRGALELLAVLSSVGFPLLKHGGYLDLAVIASQMCTAAAERLDDPLWRAYADIRRSHALIPVGAPGRAMEIARRAIDTAEPLAGDGQAGSRVYGFAHLTAAVWSAYAGRGAEAEEHLTAAAQVARRVADGDWWDVWFGPSNIAIHRAQVAAVLGEGGRLPALAEAVHEDRVPSAVQRSYLHIYVGHGLIGERGRADDAVAELRQAEDLAPGRFRIRKVVPPLVMELFGRPMRPASLRELRGLAYRVGLDAA